MRIGLAYDLKESICLGGIYPDDALEEYDSPETVEAIAAAIENLGHSVVGLGGGREFLDSITHEIVDFVFNISEGRGAHKSRESQVPCVLEMLDVPYSGSDPQCLAICLDKPMTKQILAFSGIITPRWRVIGDTRALVTTGWDDFPFPAFVKPAHEGSSKGVSAGSNVGNVAQTVDTATYLLEHYHQPVMVEEFIDGDEVTVGIVGNSPPQVVGVMRILPKSGGSNLIYSIEVKRDWEQLVEYECPARLDEDILQKIVDSSIKIFKLLGCRDFARIDFRVSHEGVPYFLEINPLAGLNPRSSDLPIMVGKLGWSYQSLISAILTAALERYPQCVLMQQ